MTSWASPRDEFPDSVHALMSLWGGFTPATQQSSDGAIEKRLELDFAVAVADACAVLSAADVEQLMLPLGQELEDFTVQDDRAMLSVTFTDALVVLLSDKLIVTTGSTVRLHRLLRPLLARLAERGTAVDWAQFTRKNFASPWAVTGEGDATSDIMAAEYAELKAAFPCGQSFITGPVDGDHYFQFVYDNIERTPAAVAAGKEERDVQVNVFLYDCEGLAADTANGRKATQRVESLPPSAEDGAASYEMLRTFATVPHLSFETNSIAAARSPARVAELVQRYAPSRFIAVSLSDRGFDDGDDQPLASFDGYVRQHRSVNYFGVGYAFNQLVFVRAD